MWTVETVGKLRKVLESFSDECSITINGMPLLIEYEMYEGIGELYVIENGVWVCECGSKHYSPYKGLKCFNCEKIYTTT